MKERNLTFKRLIGDKGEEASAKLLHDKGFTIITRNYSVHNVGEIDIIEAPILIRQSPSQPLKGGKS